MKEKYWLTWTRSAAILRVNEDTAQSRETGDWFRVQNVTAIEFQNRGVVQKVGVHYRPNRHG